MFGKISRNLNQNIHQNSASSSSFNFTEEIVVDASCLESTLKSRFWGKFCKSNQQQQLRRWRRRIHDHSCACLSPPAFLATSARQPASIHLLVFFVPILMDTKQRLRSGSLLSPPSSNKQASTHASEQLWTNNNEADLRRWVNHRRWWWQELLHGLACFSAAPTGCLLPCTSRVKPSKQAASRACSWVMARPKSGTWLNHCPLLHFQMNDKSFETSSDSYQDPGPSKANLYSPLQQIWPLKRI